MSKYIAIAAVLAGMLLVAATPATAREYRVEVRTGGTLGNLGSFEVSYHDKVYRVGFIANQGKRIPERLNYSRVLD